MSTYLAWYLEKSVEYDKTEYDVFNDIDMTSYEDDFFWAHFLLPPVNMSGNIIKGIIAVCGFEKEKILDKYPSIREYFNIVYHSQWASIPKNTWADGLYSLYPNKKREQWFRATYPDREHQDLAPFQSADFVNESMFKPALKPVKKNIDVFWVSRMASFKNLDIVAQSLVIYHKKYGRRLRVFMPLENDFISNKDKQKHYKNMMDTLDAGGGRASSYIKFSDGPVGHFNMPHHYQSSKLYLLGSLFEGKNRCLFESIYSATPIVCFKDYNKPVRGDCEIFPDGCGLLAPEFSPESLADTIHQLLQNHGDLNLGK